MADGREARRDRLKIFLGATPGVGKTYPMLRAARSRRDAGESKGLTSDCV
jgi:two-component system, OmpR family, sensor histidine kinase KdpD